MKRKILPVVLTLLMVLTMIPMTAFAIDDAPSGNWSDYAATDFAGGAGTKEHFYDTLTEGKADAALAASLFHFKELEIMDLKHYLADRGLSVRR